MYALMEYKGKQYKAAKGALLKVDKIDAEIGSQIDIDTVLLLSTDKVAVGAPYLAGVTVSAVVESHEKDRKIIVFKHKAKKGYRRKRGHRQPYSTIRIQDIVELDDCRQP